MVTKADLRDRVLQELEALTPGQAATAEDTIVVERKIDGVHAELAEDQDNFWGSLTDMPLSVQDHFVNMVAARSAKVFFVPADRVQVLRADGIIGLREIRKSGSTAVAGPTRAEYF